VLYWRMVSDRCTYTAFEMNIPRSAGGIIKRDIKLAFELVVSPKKHNPSVGLLYVYRMLAIQFSWLLNNVSYTHSCVKSYLAGLLTYTIVDLPRALFCVQVSKAIEVCTKK
jgi:hypothetical protein